MYVQDQVGAGFSNWLVIDGQQLLITLTLLMVALRDHLAEVAWTGNVPSVAQIDDETFEKQFRDRGSWLSRLNRRCRFNQPKVRSTTHRRGSA